MRGPLMRLSSALAACLLAAACRSGVPRVSLCELAKNPAKYNHQEIEISGFVSHAFEDFTIFDPTCESPEVRVWLEYGGRYGSGTTYCCNDPSQVRTQDLVVDGLRTTLRQDGAFRTFDSLIQRHEDTIVHARLRGRYFSGEKQQLPGGTMWTGYGHFGLTTLFVIEEVVRVDPQDLANIDYRASYDHPDMSEQGCFASGLRAPSHEEAVAQQQQADGGAESWRFESPTQVALHELRPQLEGAPLTLRTTKVAPGRIVFDGTVAGRANRYFAVVSRPYWLTRDAVDPRRVIWVLTAAYEYGCPHGAGAER